MADGSTVDNLYPDPERERIPAVEGDPDAPDVNAALRRQRSRTPREPEHD